MSSNDTPVRIAVIGAGLIGQRHIRHIVDEKGCELAGVVEINPLAKETAETFGTGYFADVDSFLKEGKAEAAIIATPNDTHAAIGVKCVEAGLHLLVEKPIDSSLEAAARLAQAAEETGRKVIVGQHRRFNPYVEATKKILDAGRLGKVTVVNVLWALLKPGPYFDAAWRRESGGGPVLINLIHDIDNLRYFFGDIQRIYAESSNAVRGFEVEDTAVITLRFKSGVLGTIVVSDTVASPYNFEASTGENPMVYHSGEDCYRIFGTEATLNFPEMTIWHYSGEGESGWDVPISNQRIGVQRTIPIENQLRHFCDVIRRNAVPRCPVEEGIKTLRATMSVRESMRTGRPITL